VNVTRARRLKMKDLEAATGVGREAIRFYISEGLLPEPEKPKRNVAWYSDEHVARIRAIKHLQERRYLPLSVIRTVLEQDGPDALAAPGRIPGLEHMLPELIDDAPPAPRRPLAVVAGVAGLAEQEVREIAALGVIEVGPDDTLNFRDAAVVETWGRLRGAGFRREHGYGPEILVTYAETMRRLAREEVDQFLHRYSRRLATPEAAALGASGVRLGNELIAVLRSRAIIEALHAAS
jgi:DNA-binding transcriptional MerR regulator